MAEQPCTIGKTITIRGDVAGNEDLVVAGRVEGKITLPNRLDVDSSGMVEAEIDVGELVVSGSVRGDVRATSSVAIRGEARVTGSIRSPRVVIEEGARFSGSVEMDVDLPQGLAK